MLNNSRQPQSKLDKLYHEFKDAQEKLAKYEKFLSQSQFIINQIKSGYTAKFLQEESLNTKLTNRIIEQKEVDAATIQYLRTELDAANNKLSALVNDNSKLQSQLDNLECNAAKINDNNNLCGHCFSCKLKIAQDIAEGFEETSEKYRIALTKIANLKWWQSPLSIANSSLGINKNKNKYK